MFSVDTSNRLNPRLSRRDCLRVGALGLGGLSLPQLLRLREAQGATGPTAGGGKPAARRPKSVIMIWLRGGASHIDSYDMKPDAPVEVRGEFRPTATNVPGIQICDLMPKQTEIMDKLAIVRGIKSIDLGDHTPHYILTGFPDRGKRPVIGAIVSKLHPRTDGLPPYVSLMYQPPGLYDTEGPTYVGAAHRPFVPRAQGLTDLSLPKEVSLERLGDRRELLRSFDTMNRAIDTHGSMSAFDAHTERAMRMAASTGVREAFDLKRESQATYDRYGKFCENFLLARRIVEAGVPIVTLKVGDWDTHEYNFRDLRAQLPPLDQGFHALVTDLHERGLADDVAVVLWGEFGRAPRVSRIEGRDHWPEAGAAVIAGGGFKTGQVIGETDAHAARSKVTPYTPSNILATLYRHLGIDPEQTLPDRDGRPMHLLDDRRVVSELL
jgi:hypothetical protein